MKSTLVILFNQDFSKNIPALNRLYAHRFSQIFYLVPDHNSRLHKAYVDYSFDQRAVWLLDRLHSKLRRSIGKRNAGEIGLEDEEDFRSQLLRVVGHQFFFYHFIFQAAPKLLASRNEWFWICGDDAILNLAIDENSIWEFIANEKPVEAVICQPVISSDRWVEKIGQSVESLELRLEKSLGTAAPWRERYGLPKETGANNNTTIAVGCADFFGISRTALIRVLPYLRACFAQKIYVEVAIPNVIMRAVPDTKFLTNFNCQRVSEENERATLMQNFLMDRQNIFTHPIKLSLCSEQEFAQICGNEE